MGGRKWLYAHTYYSEEEFDEIYNRSEYDTLREKFRATHLPAVYSKVKVDVGKEKKGLLWSIWPLAGLYGVYKATRAGDHLLPKTSRKDTKGYVRK